MESSASFHANHVGTAGSPGLMPQSPRPWLILSAGEAPRLLYPRTATDLALVVEGYSPALTADPDQQEWHPISPPAETNVLILLVFDGALDDREELESELALSQLPELENDQLLTGSLERPRIRRNPERGIGEATQVAPRRPAVVILNKEWRDRLRTSAVLAFPVVEDRK